ncbi:hypothetical protein M0804_009559 [Polistes exclamans]|nr:hypothetical protein M0804_009559 [Polistes exclamans]
MVVGQDPESRRSSFLSARFLLADEYSSYDDENSGGGGGGSSGSSSSNSTDDGDSGGSSSKPPYGSGLRRSPGAALPRRTSPTSSLLRPELCSTIIPIYPCGGRYYHIIPRNPLLAP